MGSHLFARARNTKDVIVGVKYSDIADSTVAPGTTASFWLSASLDRNECTGKRERERQREIKGEAISHDVLCILTRLLCACVGKLTRAPGLPINKSKSYPQRDRYPPRQGFVFGTTLVRIPEYAGTAVVGRWYTRVYNACTRPDWRGSIYVLGFSRVIFQKG